MKKSLKNIRGVEIALGTVVVIVMLLIVLVVVSMFFLGSAGTILPAVGELANDTTEQLLGTPRMN